MALPVILFKPMESAGNLLHMKKIFIPAAVGQLSTVPGILSFVVSNLLSEVVLEVQGPSRR